MNPQPNRFFHLSLIFLVALNLVPHFSDYTVPTLAVGGLCLVWRLLYEYQLVSLPNFFTKLGLIISLFYLVYLNYGQLFGLEAGSALLICAVSLKLIDRVGYRDAMVLLFLNFTLLLARFFESQTLGITIFAAFDLVITTALLVQLHKGSQVKFDVISLLKTGGKLVLQISPLMVLLFFVFPRFSTGFLPGNQRKPSLNGFSESMEPGSIASLAQAEQMAFRVRFPKSKPSPMDMYWRGGILTGNEEMRWQKGKETQEKVVDIRGRRTDLIAQEILLEPLFNNWLFSMDKPLWIEHRSRMMQVRTRLATGRVHRMTRPMDRQFFYTAYSAPKERETLENRGRYLQSPEVTDERVLKLVETISQGAQSNEQKALRLMQFYQKQFRYTLSPGQLNTNQLGEFLFEKRVGFCEHFAASFASLMRLAGVPARVVVGFQGGKPNPLSDYFIVTSRDAHAWTEIWSDQQSRWMRFDPTTMVSPLRFEIGGQLFHSLNEEERLQASGDFANYDTGWLAQARLAVDALATNWNLFLINYDQSNQRDFLKKLGLNNINQTQLTLVSLLILLCFFLWIRLRNRPREKSSRPSHEAYLKLREKLAKIGIEKEGSEGPSDFLIRAQALIPYERETLEAFRQAYLHDFYGLESKSVNFKNMVSQVRLPPPS